MRPSPFSVLAGEHTTCATYLNECKFLCKQPCASSICAQSASAKSQQGARQPAACSVAYETTRETQLLSAASPRPSAERAVGVRGVGPSQSRRASRGLLLAAIGMHRFGACKSGNKNMYAAVGRAARHRRPPLRAR
jgi:hypothetical protein